MHTCLVGGKLIVAGRRGAGIVGLSVELVAVGCVAAEVVGVGGGRSGE